MELLDTEEMLHKFNRTADELTHVQKLLADNSMEKFYVIYTESGAANHMLHATVALFRLGASVEYVEEFINKYKKGLAPRGGQVHHSQVTSLPAC